MLLSCKIGNSTSTLERHSREMQQEFEVVFRFEGVESILLNAVVLLIELLTYSWSRFPCAHTHVHSIHSDAQCNSTYLLL